MQQHDYQFFVYIMNSASRRALYTGVCKDLVERVFEHKSGTFEGFTSDYKAGRLVYYERFTDINAAIAREKQIKRWRRDKKIHLIEMMNPDWKDLAADWYPEFSTPSIS